MTENKPCQNEAKTLQGQAFRLPPRHRLLQHGGADVVSHWHASCTCRMGRADDPLAVTDASARVHGVQGLRVADASIMPNVPCANTNLPTIMIGEKVAAMVLNER
jgi:5-(hydroxymethyl)furfural/furfural oxidase